MDGFNSDFGGKRGDNGENKILHSLYFRRT